MSTIKNSESIDALAVKAGIFQQSTDMENILLGIIQGITEFLPVSSSGHLVVFSNLFNNSLNTYEIAFLHLGTLFSIVVFYYKEIFNYFKDIKELLKITQLIIVGVLPAAAVGLLLPIEELIDSSNFILIITFVSYCFLASILIFIEKFDEGQKTLSDLTLKNAFYIGLAQSLALLPGISRSGITLATAIRLKLKKTEAIFFSLLLGIPTIFGAWLLTFLQSDNQIETSFLLPVVVAFISGLLAIKILINFTVNSKLQIFAKYCLFMGILSLATYLVNL